MPPCPLTDGMVGNPLKLALMDHPDDLRKRFENKLHQRVPDDYWAFLVAFRIVVEGMPDEDLEGEVRTYRKARDPVARNRARGVLRALSERHPEPGESLDERIRAFAEIASRQAANDPDVVRWRSTFLPDGPLHPDQVEGFVAAHIENEQPAQGPDANTADYLSWSPPFKAPYTTSFDTTLDFQNIETPRFGELVGLGESLARRFWWPDSESLYFVLTGIAPEPRQIASRATERNFGPPIIVLEIDPRTSAGRVASRYDEVRNALSEHLGGGPARSRRVRERSARLAVFISERLELSWSERRRRWNDMYPFWRSKDDGSFIRDARRAYERITGERFPPASSLMDQSGREV